jgi:hypothetical protein
LVTYDYGCAYSNNILGLEENTPDWSVFPNPAQKMLHIQGLIQSNIPYYLYNLEGRVVLSGTIDEGQDAIDFENLKTGTYLLQFIGEPSSFHKVLIAH